MCIPYLLRTGELGEFRCSRTWKSSYNKVGFSNKIHKNCRSKLDSVDYMLESTSKFEVLSVFGVCEMYCIRIHLCYTKDSSTVSSISAIYYCLNGFHDLELIFRRKLHLFFLIILQFAISSINF